jgi:hypothetical protein
MSRTGVLLFVALSTATLAMLPACSSGDVPVGATSASQDLKKQGNGSPSGNGSTCSWDGVTGYDVATGTTTSTPGTTYKVGDTFKSPDGCNDCSCTAQGIACTLLACAPGSTDGGAPDPGAGSCVYYGKTYASGATFRSSDGCNGCGCNNGEVACTDAACAPAPGTCIKTGCSGEICSATSVASSCVFNATYACYATATCAVQADGQCGFTSTPALEQCLHGK